MKLKRYSSIFISLLAFIFTFSVISTPIANAQNLTSIEDALNNSTYYSIKTHTIILNEYEALSLNSNITPGQINQVKTQLKNLTSEQIDQILIDNNYDPDEIKVDTEVGHANAIIWIVAVVLAIVVVGALIFSAKYFAHKEKMTLINKCYANKGYPTIDSRDKSGFNGTTKSAAAKNAGGYKFSCKKK